MSHESLAPNCFYTKLTCLDYVLYHSAALLPAVRESDSFQDTTTNYLLSTGKSPVDLIWITVSLDVLLYGLILFYVTLFISSLSDRKTTPRLHYFTNLFTYNAENQRKFGSQWRFQCNIWNMLFCVFLSKTNSVWIRFYCVFNVPLASPATAHSGFQWCLMSLFSIFC